MNFELVEGTLVRKSQKIFGFLLTNSYLCTRNSRGAHKSWAEMIPSKPDSDNADVGMECRLIQQDFPLYIIN